LDALIAVKERLDGSLTFRRSCAHGVCGSDAMMINGRNQLACKTLVRQFLPKTGVQRRPIEIAPLKGFRVIKDLVVDMDGFFAKYRKIKPYLIAPDTGPDERERRQSPEELSRYEDTTKCILCAACTTSCPTFWMNDNYVGPQAIVAAHRFIMDSRDRASAERLELMADADGVFRCRTVTNCLDACPRDINIVRAIAEVRQKLVSSLKDTQ
ncbi:MAG: succinate dehydrogenase iron-sulfur subunit, partial [Elusimicrobia bacterium]|nr:succinate dehydrogenase iron-sulfur subunit [Elusimicrobiota bacterium]